MNKSEFIAAVAAEAGTSKADAKKAVDAILKVTHDTVVKGDKLTLVGFGTFSRVDKPARKGNKPGTKQIVTFPAKKVAKFKVGASFAADVNK